MAQELGFLAGGGAMGQAIREHDWASTALGPAATWPQSLRTALSIMLNTKGLGTILWGPELRLLYNDLYAETLADLHPAALGQPMAAVWGETTESLLPAFRRVLETGEGYGDRLVELPFLRGGVWQTTYWDSTCSPIRGEDGHIVGLFNLALETTGQVIGDRLRLGLADLGERLRLVDDVDAMEAGAAEVIGRTLKVSRVGYGTVSTDGQTFTVPNDWTAPGFPSLAGVYRLDDYGSFVADLRAGSTVVIDDVGTDARTAPDPQPLRSLSVGSLVNYPIVEHGRTVAILYVNDPHPRHWRPEQIEFISAAGDRVRQATERRRAEVALRALNANLEERIEERSAALRLYRDIVQSDGSPVVAFDTSMRIIAFNHAHAKAYRRVYGIEQRVGDSLLEQFLPEQAEAVRGLMARALAGESFVVRAAFGDPELDTPEWQISYNPLRDADGVIVGGFHHAIDVTAEVHAQRELGQIQDALRQSQKMEAIGQLTGGVAHDFNNLLTVIRGSVDLLRRPDLSSERRVKYIDAIGDTADRAARLTGQLLAFARRQALSPEQFDVGASIDEVGAMVRTLSGSRIVLDLRRPKIPLFVLADRSQLDTAVVNLAINGRDSMNGEGRLTIAVGAVSNLPARRAHEMIAGDFVAIAVTDEGVGIAEADLQRVFEPFFTTKPTGHGTGLGLSQVIGFAKQSGGDVTVESRLGHGTTFTLYLPRVADDGLAPAVVEVEARGDGAGVCVLLVEDNVSVGDFAVGALQELGYDSVLARDGEQALAELEKDCARFHILFTDVVMPGMGGLALAERVRRDYPHLPVILTSGYSHVLAEYGAHGYELLHKPYSVDQLSRVLHKAIAWHDANTAAQSTSP